jgi:predicted metalloenzyme YecM
MDILELFERSSLENFYQRYSATVEFLLNRMQLKGTKVPDHIGVLVHDKKEYNEVSLILQKYSTRIREIVLNDRRVSVYKLDMPLIGSYLMPKIEIFEPKPGVVEKNLRYGVEHIAFYISEWDQFKSDNLNVLPLAKDFKVGTTSMLKTEIINTIEIEFRDERLGEESLE